MKTREQIYSKEASELLRDITMYHCVKHEQLLRLYPGMEQKINNLLVHLVKQGRIFYDSGQDIYYDSRDMSIDTDTLKAIWVLADFAERAEYHSSDDFPIKIIFFADGEVYEIICISPDNEALIEYVMSCRSEENAGKRIMIVEDTEQISRIHIQNAVFCMVDINTGEVKYYRKEQESKDEQKCNV